MRGSGALLAAVAALAAVAPADAGSVLGIDLGSEFFKVSLVKPGMPLDIVLNIESKRKTATMVGFNDGEQQFSAAAANTVRTAAASRAHPPQMPPHPAVVVDGIADCANIAPIRDLNAAARLLAH